MTKYSELTLITALAADDVIPVLDASIPGTRGIEITDLFQGIPVDVSIGIAVGDGTLHVHTASAGAVVAQSTADDLVVENSTHGGISILTPANSVGTLAFASPTSSTRGLIRYYHVGDEFQFWAADTMVVTLSTTGSLLMKEAAAAVADVAGLGQLWIKSDAPNILMFTDDAGADFTVDVSAV